MMKLADITILALDCQATGASPAKGHLLEIGWVKTRAADAADSGTLQVESAFVALPPEASIPPAVQRVTGLSMAEMKKALPADRIWIQIVAVCRKIAAAEHLKRCPTVIHYARFEDPFLRHLHAVNGPNGDFPLHIICSHAIACRLLPGLPRKGLRAVAGFMGHSVPKLRRAADHAIATAVIWRHLVERLQAEHGIEEMDQFIEWLKHPSVQGRTKRVFPMKAEVRRHLPDEPGVYRMRRCNGDLLYIGKATSLKQRVNSYFGQKSVRAEHTLEMLSQAAGLDVIRTGSALEAAMLESDEIKRLAPPYNVALQKEGRSLVYLSRDLLQCAKKPDRTHCIGPLPGGNPATVITAFGAWQAENRGKDKADLRRIGTAILGVPESLGSPLDCLAEGLTMFRDRHHRWFLGHLPLQTLRGLGVSLWRERLAALESTHVESPEKRDQEKDGEPVLEPQQEPTWTPDMVARAVENAVMLGARLIRRSRWLCLLTECTLAWEMRDSSNGVKHVLLFESGVAGCREKLPVEAETPLPPGYANRMVERQKMFDVATYERLRVVTTELRRLVGEGRRLEIRLKPNATLRRRHIAAILPWV